VAAGADNSVTALRPASEYELGRLARLFTDAYEGYYLPFAVDEPTLRFMVEAYDLDLDASRVALRDGVPVGLANLGVRGDRGWIGGIGVVAAARRRGLARALMGAVLDAARERGLSEIWLEVLEQNEPAHRLYDELGFMTIRRVDVWVLDKGDGADAREASLDKAQELIRDLRREPEPWQRADETVERLRTLEPPPSGLVADGGAAVYRQTPQAVSVLQIAGDGAAAGNLLGALRARGALNVLNLPEDDPATPVLQRLGGRVAARQREMRLLL
jgi:ribosomal protein S18 acetylase RimI-like enzyme